MPHAVVAPVTEPRSNRTSLSKDPALCLPRPDVINEALKIGEEGHMTKNGSVPEVKKSKPRRSGLTLKEQQAELLAFCLGDYMVSRDRGRGVPQAANARYPNPRTPDPADIVITTG